MHDDRDDAVPEVLTPPFSPQLIADLHAGMLPVSVAKELWPRAHADADSAAVLAALDATLADLHTLAGEVEPMPDLVAARLQQTLSVEPADLTYSATTPSQITPTAGPRRSARFATLAAAAAVLVGLGGFFGFHQLNSDPLTPTTQASSTQVTTTVPSGTPAVEIANGQIPRAAALALRDTAVVGRLADAELRSDCLSANGYADSTQLLGSGTAKVGQRIGTLLLIPGDRPPNVIALVVGDRCTATNPDLLAVNTVSD